jgi:hypothetical protein
MVMVNVLMKHVNVLKAGALRLILQHIEHQTVLLEHVHLVSLGVI